MFSDRNITEKNTVNSGDKLENVVTLLIGIDLSTKYHK
jgi:hypothetical protein